MADDSQVMNNFRGKAITAIVKQIAAMVTESNGFDNQQYVEDRCRDVANPPDYLPVRDDGDNGGDMVLRCRWN